VTITAAADGSALGNPGPAGWAWYIDDDHWGAGGWPHGTNNMGELKAVLELLRATAHLDEDLLILCDSQYVINSVTKWMAGWKRRGWRKGDGKPVLNVDLLRELDDALDGRRYRFEWVRGHAGHELNEAADVRARAAATAHSRRAEVPAGPGYPSGGSVGAAAGTGHDGDEDAGAGAERSAARAAAPREAPVPARAPTASAALFDLDDDPADDEDAAGHRELTVRLDAHEHERLLRRARAAGVSPDELIRRLI